MPDLVHNGGNLVWRGASIEGTIDVGAGNLGCVVLIVEGISEKADTWSRHPSGIGTLASIVSTKDWAWVDTVSTGLGSSKTGIHIQCLGSRCAIII